MTYLKVSTHATSAKQQASAALQRPYSDCCRLNKLLQWSNTQVATLALSSRVLMNSGMTCLM